jgi:hypothetical protein|tara:strand:+ start:1002 stop:1307 length:306 start_codon:yes stop_codon:yes gene_type:complete
MLNSPRIGLILNRSADINAAPEKQERKAGSTGDAMDTHRRTGEEGPVPFRSSRFFCVGSKWYFTTREGFDSGPFASRERAETGLKRFLHVVRMLPEEQQLH